MTASKNSITRPALKRLLTKSKTEGTKALIYVYLYKDESPDNPLRDLPYNEREQEARFRAFGSYSHVLDEDWTPLIEAAVASYIPTEEEKDIYTYNKKIDELNHLLQHTYPKIYKNENLNSGVVSFATNIGIINMILKDIINIIQAKASLVAMYTLGTIPKHLRGGLSPLSKQSLNVTTKEHA